MANDPNSDRFRPPEIPTLVGCLHCGEEYDSYLIEWRVLRSHDGQMRGFWCCPTQGCDGLGYGCDILPVDPDFRDENRGWSHDDDGDDDDLPLADNNPTTSNDSSSPESMSAPDEEMRWDDEDDDIPF